MISSDVVVIGGGVVGTAITYYLAVRGLAPTLIERHDLASGTSGACGGSITMQTKRAGPVLGCAIQSQDLYRALGDELGHDLEYQEQGSLVVAETDDELEYLTALVAAQAVAGLHLDWLDGPAARAWGDLGRSVQGASFCPTDAEVNPLRVVFAFGEAARRHGGRILTHTRVTGIRADRDGVAGVQTDRGDFAARTIVNAAGVWSPMIGQMVGVDVPVRPRRGVVVVTEPAPFSVRGTLFSAKYLISKRHPAGGSTANDGNSTFTGGLVLSEAVAGNLLVGSSREFAEYDVGAPVDVIDFIVREAVRIIPAIAGVRMIRAYAGLRPLSGDGLPIIGNVPRLPGLVLATGHEGDGVALAPWTGKAVADLIVSGAPSEELAPFDPRRFAEAV